MRIERMWRKFKVVFYDSFLFILIYELLEEAMEDVIAYMVTDAFFNFVSTILCVTITQSIKVIVKKMIKILTYKEGNDKMKLLKKLLYIIYFNKCTIIMIALTAFSSFSAYKILQLDNCLKILICVSIMAIGILCAINIGYETYDEIVERLEKNKIKKQNKLQKRQENKIKKQEIKFKKNVQKRIEKEKEKEIKLQEQKILEEFRKEIENQVNNEYENFLKAKENKIEQEKVVNAQNEAIIGQSRVENK